MQNQFYPKVRGTYRPRLGWMHFPGLHQNSLLAGLVGEGLPVESRFAWLSVKGRTYDALRIMMILALPEHRVLLVLHPCQETGVCR